MTGCFTKHGRQLYTPLFLASSIPPKHETCKSKKAWTMLTYQVTETETHAARRSINDHA